MDSTNKNLQSAYLTTQAATKESLVLTNDFGFQGEVCQLGYIQRHTVLYPQDEICSKIRKNRQRVLTKYR
jgi:hypothetical protein